MSDSDTKLTATHGFNPFSHHWVKRDGPVWKRLVKAGQAKDPELMRQLEEKARARLKKPSVKPTLEEKALPAKSRAKRAAKIIDSHRSELDDLESDAADEHLRKLLAKRLSLAETASEVPSSDSEEEPVSRRPRRPKPSTQSGPLTTRIRLKSEPIAIPERRGAKKVQAAELSDSEEDP